MAKIVSEKIKINGHDLSALIYCFKGIVESNQSMKNEAAVAFSKTSKSIQDFYTENYAVPLEELELEKKNYDTTFFENLPKNEKGETLRSDETDKQYFEGLKNLKTIERSKEILSKEVEIDIWRIPFSYVKELNYALSVKDNRGDMRIPEYAVMEKYNIIYK